MLNSKEHMFIPETNDKSLTEFSDHDNLARQVLTTDLSKNDKASSSETSSSKTPSRTPSAPPDKSNDHGENERDYFRLKTPDFLLEEREEKQSTSITPRRHYRNKKGKGKRREYSRSVISTENK